MSKAVIKFDGIAGLLVGYLAFFYSTNDVFQFAGMLLMLTFAFLMVRTFFKHTPYHTIVGILLLVYAVRLLFIDLEFTTIAMAIFLFADGVTFILSWNPDENTTPQSDSML
jgi:hypothetical protein